MTVSINLNSKTAQIQDNSPKKDKVLQLSLKVGKCGALDLSEINTYANTEAQVLVLKPDEEQKITLGVWKDDLYTIFNTCPSIKQVVANCSMVMKKEQGAYIPSFKDTRTLFTHYGRREVHIAEEITVQ